MSHLCRLKTKSHGDDGLWAYNEIVRLRKECYELLANSRTCNWEYDEDDGYWAGDCGIAFCIEEETPSKNNMNYCPKCGGKLVEFLKKKGTEQ